MLRPCSSSARARAEPRQGTTSTSHGASTTTSELTEPKRSRRITPRWREPTTIKVGGLLLRHVDDRVGRVTARLENIRLDSALAQRPRGIVEEPPVLLLLGRIDEVGQDGNRVERLRDADDGHPTGHGGGDLGRARERALGLGRTVVADQDLPHCHHLLASACARRLPRSCVEHLAVRGGLRGSGLAAAGRRLFLDPTTKEPL
jgi:hypothetical protein